MKKLKDLWRGDLPLLEAFWTWTVTVGLAVNITTTILFLTLMTLDRPWMALFVGYALSVPCNIIAVVGGWRSAEHYEGPDIHGDLARGGERHADGSVEPHVRSPMLGPASAGSFRVAAPAAEVRAATGRW
nr:hypothetical protein [Paracoccus saliphilus]